MQAFLIERLYPTGWRRSGELSWRYSDAIHEAQRLLQEQEARGVRVLPVKLIAEPVYEQIREGADNAV